MTDATGAIVAVIALKQSGILDKFMDYEKKKPGTVYTYDPGVNPEVKIGETTFKNKGECKAWFHNRNLPVPTQCR